MSTLDTLHYEGNILDQIKELQRRLDALERTELSGVVGPQGPIGATGAQGPEGPGAPAGAVEGDIVYYDATPEAAALNIGTTTQLLQVNAGATAPEWVTATNANLANRTRLLWVPAEDTNNSTLGAACARNTIRGWTMPDLNDCRAYTTFTCPADFVSTMTVNCVFESPSSGNARVSLTVFHGADGQSYTTHTASIAATDEAIVADINDDFTTPLALPNMAAGDFVLCQFQRDGAHVNDTVGDVVYFVGFLVSYTADM